jgi:phage gp36-like protein
MDYCTQSDVLAASDTETLIGLTDDENSGDVDDVIVLIAIGKATEEINARLRTFMPALPTMPEPLLTRIATQIALYHLYLRRGLTEVRKDEYATCQQMLKDLQSGKLRLEIPVTTDVDLSPGAAFTRPTVIVDQVPTNFLTRYGA